MPRLAAFVLITMGDRRTDSALDIQYLGAFDIGAMCCEQSSIL